MSRIQKLPQNILEDITPHLVSDETIGKALYQDSQLPTKIWLIETNQAIIFHGQEPNQKPVVMACPADEIKEIDYLKKDDFVNVVFYYGKNGKAGFKFKKEDFKEIDEFLMNFSDLITARYKDKNGKIQILQRALPIGDKERRVFGRGVKNVTKKGEEWRGWVEKAEKEEKAESKALDKNPIKDKGRSQDKPKEKAQDKSQENKEGERKEEAKNGEEGLKKDEEGVKKGKEGIKTDFANHPPPSKKIPLKEEKPENEKDYGNPIYFISVTITATAMAFLCLAFFKTLSRVASYLKKS